MSLADSPSGMAVVDTIVRSRASAGVSHSKVTPTTWSPAPRANRISVVDGRRDTIRMPRPYAGRRRGIPSRRVRGLGWHHGELGISGGARHPRGAGARGVRQLARHGEAAAQLGRPGAGGPGLVGAAAGRAGAPRPVGRVVATA